MSSITDGAPNQTGAALVDGSLFDHLTRLYVFVDDWLKAHANVAAWRRSNHRAPAFTDAEVITIALMQGALGCATLKKTYKNIANNCRSAFPRLCSYGQWIARLHALGAIIGQLIQAALGIQGLPPELFYLADGKPIPVCKPIRHGRVRLLREDGAYFGKSSTGWFFGFKLHVLTHVSGSILAAILTPACWSERDVVVALGWSVEGGVVLADRGYHGAEFKQEVYEQTGLLVVTPEDAGDKNSPKRLLLSSVRERIETTFSQLWSHFVDRVYSRSWNGLWTTIRLKILYYNLMQAQLMPA